MIVTRGNMEKVDYNAILDIYKNIKANENDTLFEDNRELLEAIIPSKDVREYTKKIGFEFDSFILAALLSRAEMPFFRKIKEYKQIYESRVAFDQINYLVSLLDYINYMLCSYYSFISNEDKECFYTVSSYYVEDGKYEDNCSFNRYEDAREFSKRLKGRDFKILKTRPVNEMSDIADLELYEDFICCEMGISFYNEKGELIKCNSYTIPEPVDVNDAFYKAYVYIPFPFRHGDFVKDLSCNGSIGMINGPKNEDDVVERYIKWPEKMKEDGYEPDYSDYTINYESLRNKKDQYDWAYDHVSPLYLEYADNDFENTEEGSLERVMSLLKDVSLGKTMIFCLEYEVENYRKKQGVKRELVDICNQIEREVTV